LTTSGDDIGPQPPSALRVAGGAVSSSPSTLLDDVTTSPRRVDGEYDTAAHATPLALLVQRLPRELSLSVSLPLDGGDLPRL